MYSKFPEAPATTEVVSASDESFSGAISLTSFANGQISDAESSIRDGKTEVRRNNMNLPEFSSTIELTKLMKIKASWIYFQKLEQIKDQEKEKELISEELEDKA